MKCPYCSNEIDNNVDKCPICGVDLEYQIQTKKNNTIGSIICIIIGVVFLFFGLVSGIMMNSTRNTFGVNNETISSTMTIVSVIPLFIGLLLGGIGVFGVISNRHLKDGNPAGSNKASSVVSVMMMTMFMVIWFTVLSFIMVGFKSSGAFNKPVMIIFFAPFTIVPIVMMVSVITAIVKGKRK